MTFTSVNDNSASGTTGSGSPAAGDWGGIQVDSAGSLNLDYPAIDHA